MSAVCSPHSTSGQSVGTPSERARPTPQMPSPSRDQGWAAHTSNTPCSREEFPRSPSGNRGTPPWAGGSKEPAFSYTQVWGLVTALPQSLGGGRKEVGTQEPSGRVADGLFLPQFSGPCTGRTLKNRLVCLSSACPGVTAAGKQVSVNPLPHQEQGWPPRRRKQPCYQAAESHQQPVPFDH